MSKYNLLKQTALSFPETTEAAHFEKTAFKVKKKIFVTYTDKQNQVTLKLSLSDQDVFSLIGKDAIYPVPNNWGKKGWTIFEIDKLGAEILTDALKAAYCEVAPKKLADQLQSNSNE